MKKLHVKLIPFVWESKKEVLHFFFDLINQNKKFQPVVTFNFSMWGRHPQDVLKWLIQNALFIADGIGISLITLFVHKKWVPRYPGIDLAYDLLCHRYPLNVALIGGTSSVINTTLINLNAKFPHHNFYFSKDGYTPFNRTDVLAITKLRPHLILVAMGCPQQDELIYELSNHLSSGIAIGIGGSFDVWSGTKKRAPKIFQLLGIEWLYRLVCEPKRSRFFFSSIKWWFKNCYR
jgi:N-acetylglucosaminyldiphosphoundecaprenol N-acetyl-beta-D-mannosaminyltransferase